MLREVKFECGGVESQSVSVVAVWRERRGAALRRDPNRRGR